VRNSPVKALAFALTVLSAPGISHLRAEEPLTRVAPDAGWNAVFDRTDGWTGADAAGSVDLGDGRTLWLFADTWIGKIRDGKRAPGAWIVNNTIAIHPTDKSAPWRPPDPHTVQFYWGPLDKEKHPTAWLVPPTTPGRVESEENREWYWATGGGVVGSPENGKGRRLIAFFFRVRRDPHGKGVWNFAIVGSSLAVIDNLSDPPEHWRPRVFDIPKTGRIEASAGDRIPLEMLWGLSACVPRETASAASRVLVCGTRKSGPFDMSLVLARAPAESIERFDAWRFVGGSDAPSSQSTDARPIAKGLVSEFSVEQVDQGGRSMWVLIQSEPFFGRRIFARTASRPEGPWSAPRTVYSVPEVVTNRSYFTYAAKGHARLSRPGELLVTYLVNAQSLGDVVRDTTIYHPKFLRVPTADLFGK
jgi:hypothetical protein